MSELKKMFQSIIEEGTADSEGENGTAFVKAIFSNKRKKSQPENKAVIRPVMLKKGISYQLEMHYDKKVTHENIAAADLSDRCVCLVEELFKQVNIQTGKK